MAEVIEAGRFKRGSLVRKDVEEGRWIEEEEWYVGSAECECACLTSGIRGERSESAACRG